jgi:hypothetical protein
MSFSATFQRVKYHCLYRWMHLSGGMFVGHSLEPHAARIGELMRSIHAHSALDYGCGKGKQYHTMRMHEQHGWGLMPTLYDPGVRTLARLPDGPFDAVICTDVMEHIPIPLLEDNLRRIFDRATRLVYLSISTRPAAKTLPNGENAHCTVQSALWWMDVISRHAKASQWVEASFQGTADTPAQIHTLNAPAA